MLHVQRILPDKAFVIKMNGVLPKLSAELENEVERIWLAEQNRHRKTIFNGHIMSASTVSSDGIYGYTAEYRHWIAQRARPELFKDLPLRPVAVSGLLECKDGVVLGRRAASMTQDAGLLELVPSGGIDISKINDDIHQQSNVNVDFLSQILTELHEEIGIKSGFVSRVKPFCLVEDTKSRVLDIGIAIESPLSYDEILTIHRNTATKEYDKLRLVPRSEMNQ